MSYWLPGAHFSHPEIARIGDIQVAQSIHGDATGEVQTGLAGGPAVAAEASEQWASTAHHRGDDPIGSDTTDSMTGVLGNVEISNLINGDINGPPNDGLGGWTAIAKLLLVRNVERSVSGDRGNRAISADPAHALIEEVGDEQIATRTDGQAAEPVERRRRGWTTIAGKPTGAASGDSCDDSRGAINSANAVVTHIGDVQIPLDIECQSRRIHESRRRGQTSITAESRFSRSRHRSDDSIAINAPNAVVAIIGDVEISLCVGDHVGGRSQHSLQSRLTVAVESRPIRSQTGDARDDPGGGIDLSDDLIGGLSNIQVPLGVDGQSLHGVQFGLNGGPAVAAEASHSRSSDGSNDFVFSLNWPSAQHHTECENAD